MRTLRNKNCFTRSTAFAAGTAEALLLTFCGTPRAFADSDVPAAGLAVGVFVPGSTSQGDSKAWPSIEFRYALPRANPEEASSRTVLSVGAFVHQYSNQVISYGGGGFLMGGQQSGTDVYLPITISQVFRLSGRSPLAAKATFAGVGIGAVIYVGFGAGGASVGFVELGHNVTSHVFIDAKYMVNLSGFLLTTGLRF